jgi:hypothetical protein
MGRLMLMQFLARELERDEAEQEENRPVVLN